MNLSIFDGDSSNEEEKSRISVIKRYAIVQTRKRAGWFLVEQYKSGSRYQIIQWVTTTNKLQPKNKIKDKTEQPQQQATRKRQSVVRQELASPRATPNKEMPRFARVCFPNCKIWEQNREITCNGYTVEYGRKYRSEYGSKRIKLSMALYEQSH